MATALSRLGRWAFRHRWSTVGLWLALLVALGAVGAAFQGETDNSFTLPGSQSQQAIDTLNARFPAASGSTASIVFAPPAGQKVTDPGVSAAITRVIEAARNLPHTVELPGPAVPNSVAPDGSLAVANVAYDVPTTDLGDTDRNDLEATAAAGRAAGLTVEFSGAIVTGGDKSSAAEAVGLILALFILIITFGSLAAAGMPLLTGMVGVSVGLAGLTALSGVVSLSATAPVLAAMLGLAVGIDYALFIVSRHRSQLAKGMDTEDSVALAVGTAGSAVVFAGLTVLIALVGLSLVNIKFLTVMGLAAAGTVLVTVLVALTLVPAMLAIAGKRLVPAANSRAAKRETQTKTIGHNWVQFVTSRPVPVLLIGTLALCTLALPVLSMRLGLPSAGSAAPDSTERKSYELIAAHLGAGANGPLTILVDTKSTGGSAIKAAAKVSAELGTLSKDSGIVTPAVPAPDGTLAVMSLIPKSAPDSEATAALVRTIRHAEAELEKSTGSDVSVTGTTALGIDVSDALSSALPRFLAVVVGLALLLLGLVFRSIVVPVKAALGFLLTIGATLGCVVAVFQWGWLANVFGVNSTSPIISFLPVLMVGILFGLAMDYEVFLVSRIREDHVHGSEAHEAVKSGFRLGARVVTAAALIMTSVFSGFMITEDNVIKSLGFALALGVLIDAFVVRMTLVPAVLALFGKAAWWLPSWLEKALPRIDIEGEALRTKPTAPSGSVSDEAIVEPVG